MTDSTTVLWTLEHEYYGAPPDSRSQIGSGLAGDRETALREGLEAAADWFNKEIAGIVAEVKDLAEEEDLTFHEALEEGTDRGGLLAETLNDDSDFDWTVPQTADDIDALETDAELVKDWPDTRCYTLSSRQGLRLRLS